MAGIKELIKDVDKSQIAGISFGGQMHGLVILDENDNVIGKEKLSGVHCTDVSDASGMLLFDVKNRCWSKEMCEICGKP